MKEKVIWLLSWVDMWNALSSVEEFLYVCTTPGIYLYVLSSESFSKKSIPKQ